MVHGRAFGYEDSLGYLTIGVGRLIDRRLGGGLTEAEVSYLLANDIAGVMADLDRELPWWRGLNDVRQRVIIDMCFNLGIANFLLFKNTLAAVKRGDWGAASRGMMNSRWARQVKSRAVTLTAMMETGKDPKWLA